MVVRLAAAAGIECHPLSFYAMQEPTASGPVLGFAAIAPAEIKFAARKLAQMLEPICV
jgi:DNA-binding transcriptional MocR family regulator